MLATPSTNRGTSTYVPGKSHSNVAVLRFVMPFARDLKFVPDSLRLLLNKRYSYKYIGEQVNVL